jgi:hypothetical protein
MIASALLKGVLLGVVGFTVFTVIYWMAWFPPRANTAVGLAAVKALVTHNPLYWDNRRRHDCAGLPDNAHVACPGQITVTEKGRAGFPGAAVLVDIAIGAALAKWKQQRLRSWRCKSSAWQRAVRLCGSHRRYFARLAGLMLPKPHHLSLRR